MNTFNRRTLYFNKRIYKKLLKTDIGIKYSDYFPSLLSLSFLKSGKFFWEKRYTIKFINPIKIFYRILRFFISSSYILFASYFSKFFLKRKNIFLITRSPGIKNKKSLEDYRFENLEKELKSQNFGIFYYVIGSSSPNLYSTPCVYSSDLESFCSIIFNTIFVLRKFFCKRNYYLWYVSLIKIKFETKISRILLLFSDVLFFWDFNYQNYSLMMAGNLNKLDLFGSIHGFHNIIHMPWTQYDFCKLRNSNLIFNNYKEIYKYIDKRKSALNKVQFIQKKKLLIKKLLLVQENQSDQLKMLIWLKKNFKKDVEVFVKLRPDKAMSDEFIDNLNSVKIKYKIINYISDFKSDETLIIGQKSTLLLDLACQGFPVISFCDKKNEKWFNSPSNDYHVSSNEYFYSNQLSGNLKIYNFAYVNENDKFSANLFNKQFNTNIIAIINHLYLIEFRVVSLSNLIKKVLNYPI